jgi:hypothetical protein
MGCFMKHQFPVSVLAPRAGLPRMENYLNCSAAEFPGPAYTNFPLDATSTGFDSDQPYSAIDHS